MITRNYNIYKFPDEMVSNETKKSFEFARDYASAIWSEWESKYYSQNIHFDKLKKYALGEHDIEHIENNITNNGKLIKREFLRYDKKDRVKILPKLLRNFYNGVDMEEFVPVIKALDPTAMEVKSNRKNEKMKMFHAKDFIEEIAALNGGSSPIPLDQIPQSKEQVQLEEETAKPLRVERGELKAIEFVSIMNDFPTQQKQLLIDAVELNKMVVKVDTDPQEGIKIERINPQEHICGKGTDMFYSNSPYHGVVKEITVGMFKNICAESGLKFKDEDIKRMAGISTNDKLNDQVKICVLYYAFKTFFRESFYVKKKYNKKLQRHTGAISIIKEEDYKPNTGLDKSEKKVDNYDVWFEGIMVLDADKTIIRHRLVKNMPEHRGKIIPPYIVCSPREVGLIEESVSKVDSIQELRLRILHHRNNLKGDITEIDPDAIANVVLTPGQPPLSPQEVLSYYFTMGLAFRKTKDEDGEIIQNNRPLSQIPESIPRALIELTNQYISEINELKESFGAVQYDMVKPDPKTTMPQELYRLSDNTALRDYTNALFGLSIRVYQSVSSRINDAFKWKNIRELFMDNIGIEDVETLEQFKKDRKNHYFEVYLDHIPTKQERMDFVSDITAHIQNGELDALDKIELLQIRNPLQARASLRLRLESKRKQMQEWELNKIKENQNQNIMASNAAYENKSRLSAQEHQQKIELEQLKFQNEAFLTQKQGEIKIIETNNKSEEKFQLEEFRNKYAADLTIFKKQQDEKLRKEIQQMSAENQAKLIKLRRGEISDINEPSAEDVDLSNLQTQI